MLFYTLLYMIFTSFVNLVSRGVPEFSYPGQDDFTEIETAEYYRSNCLDHKWNLISTIKCQLGTRGPCAEGQLFSAVPDELEYEWMDVSEKTCSKSVPAGCEEAAEDPSEDEQPLSAVKSRHGVCLWTEQNHPCRGLPSGFRFHSSKKQCFLTDGLQNTGCGMDQVFTVLNKTHGRCRCRFHDDIIWPVDGRCYKRHSKGPCGSNQWLVFNSKKELVCSSTKCPIDGHHAEWTVNGKTACYRLNEQGPCPEGKYLIRKEFEVKCDDYDSDEIRRSLLRAPNSECEPGMVRDRQGRCRKPFNG